MLRLVSYACRVAIMGGAFVAILALFLLGGCAGADRNFGCGDMYFGERRGIINANGDAIVPPPTTNAGVRPGTGSYQETQSIVVNPTLNVYTVSSVISATCNAPTQQGPPLPARPQ